jgi:hypothetical protein
VGEKKFLTWIGASTSLEDNVPKREAFKGGGATIGASSCCSASREWRLETLFSTKLRSSCDTQCRQSGQVECEANHRSTQSTWKACWHFGNNRKISLSSNWHKQTAHSNPSWKIKQMIQ